MSIEKPGDLIDSVVLPVGKEEEIREKAKQEGENEDMAVRKAKEEQQATATQNIDEGERARRQLKEDFDESEK